MVRKGINSMSRLFDMKIMIDLGGLILWSLLVLTIAIVSLIRYLFFKYKLLAVIKEHDPDLFEEIRNSKATFFKFIKTAKDTGNERLDLLKFKTQRSGKLFAGLLLYILFLLLHVMIFFLTIKD